MSPKTPTAAYGAACANCSRAKSRCVVPKRGEPCERCQRLEKECVPAVSARRQGCQKAKTSKTAQLESKIDGLMGLLTSDYGTRILLGDSESLNSADRAPTERENEAFGAASVPAMRNAATPTPSLPADTAWTAVSIEAQALEFAPEEAELYLEEFRAQRLPYFPCVHIPPATTSKKLLEVRPFLWLCIMAVCTKSMSKQVKLYSSIRQIVARKMVIELESSLDLLLGLLICISWANLQFRRRPFISVYIHLANSVIHRCNLNNPPRSVLDEDSKYRFHSPHAANVRTLEERRAMLGCYLLGSYIATSLRAIDPLKWTPHMDQSLHILVETNECPGDYVLVTLCRLQLIVEKAHRCPWDTRDPRQDEAIPQTPLEFYINALAYDLTVIIESLPSDLRDADVITLHVHYTRTVIHGLYLSRYFPFSPTVPISALSFHFIESLNSVLTSSLFFVKTVRCLPVTVYPWLPTSSLFHLGHCAASLFKLSVLDVPGWSRTDVIRQANILKLGEDLAENISLAGAAAGIVRDVRAEGVKEAQRMVEDVYTQMAGLIRMAMRNWRAKLGKVGVMMEDGREIGDAFPGRDVLMEDGDARGDLDLGFDVSLVDDAWLEDFVAWLS